MVPLNLGIEIDQGSDFNVIIGVTGDCGPLDLTGYLFRGQLSISTDQTITPSASFVFTVLNQSTNMGQVQCSLSASVTSELTASVSNNLQTQRLDTPYVFDIEMKDTNNLITRIIEGIVYVSPQATQEAFS
jgi:hypothetical protein